LIGQLWAVAKDYVLYASLCLNALSAILLFFRSAINEAIRDWLGRRVQRRREAEDRLHQLHGYLALYPNYLFNLNPA
jgi:hypothetical protein